MDKAPALTARRPPCQPFTSKVSCLARRRVTHCSYASANNEKPSLTHTAGISRRAWLTTSLLLFSSPVRAGDELVNYKDSKKSYNLQRPSEWEQVEKAGADALFKAPNLRSTDLGVTVSPVRIKRLEQLGDVETVGNRLLAAEKKKESTKSIELLQQSMGTAGSGTEFYEFDYAISTTRGDKRILSKVGVANSKLYIVNGSIKCEAEACKDDTRLVQLVRQSVQSFDIIS